MPMLIIIFLSFVLKLISALACPWSSDQIKTHIVIKEPIYSLNDLHSYLASRTDFPYYYGKNLDALYDVLLNDLQRPIFFSIVHWENLSKYEQYKLKELLYDLKSELGDDFCF